MTIGALVDRERRHVRRAELATAVLTVLAVVMLVLTLGAALLGRARWLSLPRGVPMVIWLVVTAIVAWAAFQTRRTLRTRTPRHIAHVIEREQGMRLGSLVGVLELEGNGALADLAAQGVRRTLPNAQPLAPAMRRTSSRRAIAGAAAAAAGILVLMTATPLFGDGLRAVLRPIDAWRGTLLAAPVVEGAPQDLLRGSSLHLTVRAPGRQVIYFSTRQTGDAWRVDTLVVDQGTGTATWSTDVLRGDLRLVASDGRASSDSITVRAADRPFVGAVVLHAHFPRYLGRADESLPVGEVLHLPRGTSLTITGRSSVALSDVALVSAAGSRVNLASSGQTFSGTFEPTVSEALTWTARGATGIVPDVPEPLSIDVVADSAPRVLIAEPSSDTLLVATDAVELAVKASDDHGIGAIAMRMVRTGSREAAPMVRPVAGAVGTSWAGTALVPIDSLRLAPGDAIRVRLEAVDQSPWAQRGVSREIVLRRATSEEQRAAARALGDSAVKEAVAAAKAERALAQRTDEAARAQGRQQNTTKDASNTGANGQQQQQKPAMNYENAQKAKNLAQDQRAMSERVEKLRQATKQLEQQLKAAGALDSSIARQLAEAQALLKQALTPEMIAQMQKLENSAQQMNGEQSRDAMRDMAQMQQRMREQLERSAEMLKRAAHEGSMQTLGDEARELAQKERALADSSASGATPKTGQDAKDLAERADRLKDAMKDLKDRLAKDKADAGASKTDEAQQHAAKSEQQMADAAKQLDANAAEKKPASGDQQQAGQPQAGQPQAGQPKAGGEQQQQGGQPQQGGKGDGQKQARDAAAEMDKAAKSMQDARSEQVKEWKQELTSEIDRSVQEMMQLAREERALEQKVRDGQSQDDKRSAQSAVEQGVDKANERMQGEGKKSALFSPRSQRAMQDAKQKVSQATEKMTQPNGNSQQQASSLSEAADALTKAAASLARDRERANNANSASGFSEMLKEMQQMAQKQGQINGQSQSLLSLPNGMNSSQGQSMARQLARQQRQLAEQLDDAGDAAGGNRAAQLAQEARQLAEQLDNGRLDANTVARQQQLFRRLLDAGKSLEKEERDDSGKREAKSATGDDAFAPGSKVDARAAVKFRPPTWQELRGLSADERRAILDYFTRLNSGTTP